jgi:hypothetical protein
MAFAPQFAAGLIKRKMNIIEKKNSENRENYSILLLKLT